MLASRHNHNVLRWFLNRESKIRLQTPFRLRLMVTEAKRYVPSTLKRWRFSACPLHYSTLEYFCVRAIHSTVLIFNGHDTVVPDRPQFVVCFALPSLIAKYIQIAIISRHLFISVVRLHHTVSCGTSCWYRGLFFSSPSQIWVNEHRISWTPDVCIGSDASRAVLPVDQ